MIMRCAGLVWVQRSAGNDESMCGILGVFSRNDSGALDRRVADGLKALAHRGPDAHDRRTVALPTGVCHLGHARLSIIDLSSAGLQPMASADGRYVIVFNGEIYNYLELRAELQTLGCGFTSQSDTEVLLAAWATWGEACLPRLTGMFAFTVLDREEATLTCVRDAFGIKPFFYSCNSDMFCFASEAPSLLTLRGTRAALNPQRAYDYLVHGDYDSTEQTFFAGVFHLAPGHLLRLNLTERLATQACRWWTPDIAESRDLSFTEATERVRALFLDSVRLHLRSDVPLGAALSGGIDSSAVVCAMRHVAPDHPIHTFSYVAEGTAVNEEPWADLVNAHVGATAHKVTVTAEELVRDLDDMIGAQGEPFGSTSIYAQYRVYQLARDNGITVTLDGQGADEMLAGYDGYPGQRIASLVDTGNWVGAARFAREWADWPGRRLGDAAKLAAAAMTDGWLYQALRRVSGRAPLPEWMHEDALLDEGVNLRHPRQRPAVTARGRRVTAELAHSLTQRGLASLLRHGDRNSMRFAIESRVPFLTLAQAELMLSLPESYLISDAGETKAVFRAAMRGIVPDAILDRKDKIGFQTPEAAWIGTMSDTIRGWLAEDVGVSFFDQTAAVKAFDAIVAGRRPFSWQAWRWVNFVRWHQLFLA
ncbi:asparagine synthase (plasmid) [Agrobacterium sp. RAC06]|nr:asparagine synthase [Agrobacterium sp. RAC06]